MVKRAGLLIYSTGGYAMRAIIKIEISTLAEMCEKDLEYSIDTLYHENTRYEFARSKSGRRNRLVVNQTIDNNRAGVFDVPYKISILD